MSLISVTVLLHPNRCTLNKLESLFYLECFGPDRPDCAVQDGAVQDRAVQDGSEPAILGYVNV